ncbi:MAG: DnaB-like helicase C-terminal domain-containing protein [Candidatus Thorarchaeota archaeon]
MKKVYKGVTLTSRELAEEFYDDFRKKSADPEKWRGLSFGHVDLTKFTGGVRRSEFIVIAGPQKSGKTTWGLFLAQEFGKQLNHLEDDELILLVSLEMRHSGLAARVLANLSSIEVSKFRDYELEARDWRSLDAGIAKLEELPILWNVNCYSIEGLEAIVEEHKDRLRVVLVDYFQLMTTNIQVQRRHEQLEDISRRLKMMAMVGDMSVIALSQLSREALKSKKMRKDPNTIAQTQALARDADMMLYIMPFIDKDGEEAPHIREISVVLSRNSPFGEDFKTAFVGEYARVGALADIPDAPEELYGHTQDEYWDS